MKKNIVKKILSSLCAVTISLASLSAFAADSAQPGYLVIYGSQNNKFSCWIVPDYYYDSYTITSPYDSRFAVVPGDSYSFECYYSLEGQTSDTDPAYFNFTLNGRNAAGEVLSKNNLRAQYAKFGDINGDGNVDWSDANALQWFLDSSYFNETTFDNYYYMESLRPMMDFNGDTMVDQKDAAALRNYLQGKNPGSATPIGTMQWITLDQNTVSLLSMKNLNEKKLYISQDDTDVTFQLLKK